MYSIAFRSPASILEKQTRIGMSCSIRSRGTTLSAALCETRLNARAGLEWAAPIARTPAARAPVPEGLSSVRNLLRAPP
eukprot:628844-Pyramimonas_sp.AAC.1